MSLLFFHGLQWFCFPNRKKSLAGIKRKHQEQDGATDSEVEDPGQQDDQAAAESEDEAEYYRQAVGEEPDEGK